MTAQMLWMAMIAVGWDVPAELAELIMLCYDPAENTEISFAPSGWLRTEYGDDPDYDGYVSLLADGQVNPYNAHLCRCMAAWVRKVHEVNADAQLDPRYVLSTALLPWAGGCAL